MFTAAKSCNEHLYNLKSLLDHKLDLYHNTAFIDNDPIIVPHGFSKKQDIEIAGFFAAILAWGNRTTIIKNVRTLMHWMDEAPHQFILHHQPSDLKTMLGFVHRTFNATDLLYCLHRLQVHYQTHDSLEKAFTTERYHQPNIEQALRHFHEYFFALPHPDRTRKHIATPARNSACKRLCMFLRWMVRKNDGIDFGLWQAFQPAQLICPLDVHVARVAYRLQLISKEKANWTTAIELTQHLISFDPLDPVKYDFALFGLGREERF